MSTEWEKKTYQDDDKKYYNFMVILTRMNGEQTRNELFNHFKN